MSGNYKLLYQPLSEVHTDDYTSRRMVVWKIINLLMTAFFTLAALANLNDSDWYIWVPIYLVPAILSLLVVVKANITDTTIWSVFTSIILAVFISYSIYLIIILIDTIRKKSSLNNPLVHEEGRETAGMFIIIVWLTISKFTVIGRREPVLANKKLMNCVLLLTVTMAVLPLAAWSICFIGDNHKRIGHCNGMFK